MQSSDAAIRIRGLTRTFGDRNTKSEIIANDDVSLDVRRGETFGLLGANGAGKTTLVMHMMGLISPNTGTIHVEGVDVVRHPEQAKQMIGFLPQTGGAMGRLEIERALRYMGRLRGQSDEDARDQTDSLLDELGLTGLRSRSICKLSGGQARLVNFGMVLMGRPRVIILDEPTNELDPAIRRVVWRKIEQLNETKQVTCVLVTHNVLEAEKVIHRLAVMSHGKVVASGTPGELEKLLGARPGAGRRQQLARPSLEDVYLELHDGDGAAPPPPPAPPLETSFAERPPPVMSLGRRVARFSTALKYLWFEQMLEVRRTWMFTLAIHTIIPWAMVFGFARIGAGLKDATSLLYIVTGAATFSLTSEGIATLAQHIGILRARGVLLNYAALPVPKMGFLLAVAFTRMLLALPGMVTPILAGALMYDLPVSVSPWLLLLFPLASLCMASVGIGLGLLVLNHDLLVVVTNFVLFVLLLAAPVMIPMSELPVPFQLLGRVLPPTYAAEAMRLALGGDVGLTVYRDIAILALITAASLALLTRLPLWRRP